jgi:predicted GIY-YIG superfamily endonuclease
VATEAVRILHESTPTTTKFTIKPSPRGWLVQCGKFIHLTNTGSLITCPVCNECHSEELFIMLHFDESKGWSYSLGCRKTKGYIDYPMKITPSSSSSEVDSAPQTPQASQASLKVYVLQLVSGRYYVGSSRDVEGRVQAHKDGKGSAWTKKYAFDRLVETIDNCDEFDEDMYTKRYMKKYGIDNVRGGAYCQIKLSDETIKVLNKELLGSSGVCYKCQQSGHFANRCPN